VDDCPDTVASLAFLTRLWGHETWTARDGAEALRHAEAHHPAVVLLDLGLPGMDGWSLARMLRSLPGMDGAYLAAVSGYAMPEDVARSRDAGCDMHLAKPADPEDVCRILAERDPAPGPLTPAGLVTLLRDLRSAAEVVEAIDGHTRGRGWDLSGWRYELIPWGVRFCNCDGIEVALLAEVPGMKSGLNVSTPQHRPTIVVVK
jgi:CheY-like chemotaxis protein